MEALRNIHKGSTAHIIGKGPSINQLTPGHFADGFIIAFYEAIIPIRKLDLPHPTYLMQKDEIRIPPAEGEVQLLHFWESARQHNGYHPTVLWNNNDLGLGTGSMGEGFSLQSAIRLSELMGAEGIYFFGFDAHTGGEFINIDGINREADYRKQIAGMKNFKIEIPHEWK